MLKFGVIMDSIESINPKKDTTFSLISALQKRCQVEYIFPRTMHLIDDKVKAKASKIKVFKNKANYYQLSGKRLVDLNSFNAILFRVDPPVDIDYIQLTYLLDQVEKNGTLLINSPQSLRDFNEKILGINLSYKKVPTIITSNIKIIKEFIKKNKKIVIKPLNFMGGKDIYLIPNKNIDVDMLLNDLTQGEKKLIVSQKYLSKIKNGDSRIIIYNGIVHEKVLVRFPPKNDFRANLSFGGKYVIRNLPAKHKKYLYEIAEFLKMNRIYLAGVDMIGDFITEINITSPTGIQEIERECKNNLSIDIANQFINIAQSFYNHDY